MATLCTRDDIIHALGQFILRPGHVVSDACGNDVAHRCARVVDDGDMWNCVDIDGVLVHGYWSCYFGHTAIIGYDPRETNKHLDIVVHMMKRFNTKKLVVIGFEDTRNACDKILLSFPKVQTLSANVSLMDIFNTICTFSQNVTCLTKIDLHCADSFVGNLTNLVSGLEQNDIRSITLNGRYCGFTAFSRYMSRHHFEYVEFGNHVLMQCVEFKDADVDVCISCDHLCTTVAAGDYKLEEMMLNKSVVCNSLEIRQRQSIALDVLYRIAHKITSLQMPEIGNAECLLSYVRNNNVLKKLRIDQPHEHINQLVCSVALNNTLTHLLLPCGNFISRDVLAHLFSVNTTLVCLELNRIDADDLVYCMQRMNCDSALQEFDYSTPVVSPDIMEIAAKHTNITRLAKRTVRSNKNYYENGKIKLVDICRSGLALVG